MRRPYPRYIRETREGEHIVMSTYMSPAQAIRSALKDIPWFGWLRWPKPWAQWGWKVRTHWWQWRHRHDTHTVRSTVAPRDTSYLSDWQRGPQAMNNTPAQALAFRQQIAGRICREGPELLAKLLGEKE
jgi:hypothetical protein